MKSGKTIFVLYLVFYMIFLMIYSTILFYAPTDTESQIQLQEANGLNKSALSGEATIRDLGDRAYNDLNNIPRSIGSNDFTRLVFVVMSALALISVFGIFYPLW